MSIRASMFRRGVIVNQRAQSHWFPRNYVTKFIFGDTRYAYLQLSYAASKRDLEDVRAAFPEAEVQVWDDRSKAVRSVLNEAERAELRAAFLKGEALKKRNDALTSKLGHLPVVEMLEYKTAMEQTGRIDRIRATRMARAR